MSNKPLRTTAPESDLLLTVKPAFQWFGLNAKQVTISRVGEGSTFAIITAENNPHNLGVWIPTDAIDDTVIAIVCECLDKWRKINFSCSVLCRSRGELLID